MTKIAAITFFLILQGVFFQKIFTVWGGHSQAQNVYFIVCKNWKKGYGSEKIKQVNDKLQQAFM